MNKTFREVIFIIVGCLIVAYVFADNNTARLNKAIRLLEDGKPDEAYSFLMQHHDENSENPHEWFLLGMSAKELGKFSEAEKFCERVLAINPDAQRVKLEIADICFRKGDTEKAKQYLLEVKATHPPEKVGANIDKFLAIIDSPKSKKWHVYGNAGWLYDSNVNSGPDTDTVLMFGLPFHLSKDAKERSDHAFTARAGFNHYTPFNDNIAWQGNYAVSTINYSSINELDSLLFTASTGPTWRLNNKFTLSAPLVGEWIRYGYDDEYYSYSYGLAPQLRYKLSKTISLNLLTTVSNKKYNKISDKDLVRWSAEPSIDWQPDKKSYVRVAVVGGSENSGIDIFSNDLLGARVYYNRQLTDRIRGSVNASYFDTQYRGKEAAYDDERRDKAFRVGSRLIYNIKPINMDVVLSASYTNVDSNLEIYEYDKIQTSVSLSFSF
jgi:tetratricopeptide (TPR) repeat protein